MQERYTVVASKGQEGCCFGVLYEASVEPATSLTRAESGFSWVCAYWDRCNRHPDRDLKRPYPPLHCPLLPAELRGRPWAADRETGECVSD